MASIRHRPERKSPWQVLYREPDGQQRSQSFRTKKEADRYSIQVESQKLSGDYLNPDRRKVEFRELAERWMKTPHVRSVKPRTRGDWRGILNSRVLPTFAVLPVGAIERRHVETWIGGMMDEGLSASRIRNCLNVVKWVLEYAKDNGHARDNVARGVSPPSDKGEDRTYLNEQQVDALASAMKPRFRALVYVLAYGGLRWGEAAALRREHVIPFGKRHIEVRETVAEVGGERVKGTPKNHQCRKVYLPDEVWDGELAPHLATHVGEEPDALLFGTKTGMPYWNTDFRRRYFKPAVAEAGLPESLTPHGLRHTCASIMHANGANVVEIQQQLGHKTASITLDVYTHLFHERPDGVLRALGARYRERQEGGPETPGVAHMLPKQDEGASEVATG